MHKAYAQTSTSAEPLTVEEVATQYGVSVDVLEFYREQARQLMAGVIKIGLPATRAWQLFGEQALPMLEEACPGYASPEEGVVDLITQEGGCVPVADATKLYRKPRPITPQAMTRLIRGGQVIAYQSGSGSYAVPVWQFKPTGGLLDGLSEALATLRQTSPGWTQLAPFAFFLQADPLTSGDTPLHALRAGRLEDVLAAARAVAG